MLHVLLNELGIYDAAVFKAQDQCALSRRRPKGAIYTRDPSTGKPHGLRRSGQRTKTYDDPTLRDPAMPAPTRRRSRRAFALRSSAASTWRNITPEQTETITTDPGRDLKANRQGIRRGRLHRRRPSPSTAWSFPIGRSASIGPKASQGHKHGFHQCWPLKLMNIVVGAVNVPGGILSTGAAGKNPHHWWPEGGTDGLLEDGGHIMPLPHPKAFPGRTPTKPVRIDLGRVVPAGFPLSHAAPDHRRKSRALRADVRH